jgi:hypothetical protein
VRVVASDVTPEHLTPAAGARDADAIFEWIEAMHKDSPSAMPSSTSSPHAFGADVRADHQAGGSQNAARSAVPGRHWHDELQRLMAQVATSFACWRLRAPSAPAPSRRSSGEPRITRRLIGDSVQSLTLTRPMNTLNPRRVTRVLRAFPAQIRAPCRDLRGLNRSAGARASSTRRFFNSMRAESRAPRDAVRYRMSSCWSSTASATVPVSLTRWLTRGLTTRRPDTKHSPGSHNRRIP